ncbi:hypothetical protein K9K77_02935 [Candidatus Babeliales bacterium]|nr:hypothetical protein [Candidatus Babeliales bacterium]
MNKRVFMLILLWCGAHSFHVYASQNSLKEDSLNNDSSWALVAANGDIEEAVISDEISPITGKERKSPIVWEIGDDVFIDAPTVLKNENLSNSFLRKRIVTTSENNKPEQREDSPEPESLCIDITSVANMIKKEVSLTASECKEDLLLLWAGLKGLIGRH